MKTIKKIKGILRNIKLLGIDIDFTLISLTILFYDLRHTMVYYGFKLAELRCGWSFISFTLLGLEFTLSYFKNENKRELEYMIEWCGWCFLSNDEVIIQESKEEMKQYKERKK